MLSPDNSNASNANCITCLLTDPNDPRLRDMSEATGTDKFNKVKRKLFVSSSPDAYKG